MALDVVSGIVASVITKTTSSDVSHSGAWKKTLVWIVIGACAALTPLAGGIPIMKIACSFYIVDEMISIVENAAKAGVPVPPEIRSALVKIRPSSSLAKDPPIIQQTTVNNGPATINVIPGDIQAPAAQTNKGETQ